MLPRLPAATLNSPGLLFSSAISSGSVLTPSAGVTAIPSGCTPTKPIGMKSRTTSTGKFFCSSGSAMKFEASAM